MPPLRLLQQWKQTQDDGTVVTHEEGAELEVADEQAESLVAAGIAERPAGDGDISDQLKGSLDQFEAALAQRVKSAVDQATQGLQVRDGARVTVGDSEQDRQGQGYASPGEFVQDVIRAGNPEQRPSEKLLKLTNWAKQHGMHEGSGEEGGFLVPEDFSNRLMQRAVATLDVLDQCDVIPTRGNSVKLTAYIDHDRSGTTYRYGGVIPYWVAEGTQITRSQLKLREVRLELDKLAALVPLTDELMADTDGLAGRLERQIGDAIGEEAVHAAMFGTGAGQPQGAFVADCCVQLNKESGQAANSIVLENTIKMLARLYKGNGRWYYNPECLPQLLTMSLNVGTGGVAPWIPAGGAAEQPNDTIWGLRADRTDLCEALGTAGDLVLADWSRYLLARKGGINTALSVHLWFDYDETALRSTFRIGGMPAWDAALTPRKGSATVSPFIKLQSRS